MSCGNNTLDLDLTLVRVSPATPGYAQSQLQRPGTTDAARGKSDGNEAPNAKDADQNRTDTVPDRLLQCTAAAVVPAAMIIPMRVALSSKRIMKAGGFLLLIKLS